MRPKSRSSAGLTLIELMLVMGIIALVMGMGVGFFANFDLGRRTAVSLVQNTIRSARNWSINQGASARVRIQPGGSEMAALGTRVIGTWHFEKTPLEGAFGLDGTLTGGGLVDDGFQGKALSFMGAESGTGVSVPVEKDPSYDLANGFKVECAMRLEAAGSGRLVTLGSAFGLSVTRAAAVRAQFRNVTVDEKTKEEQPGGIVTIESPDGALHVGRWAYVEAEYDRRTFRLSIDGIEVARLAETAPVWKVDEPLRISGGRPSFPGSIDSLVISAVSAEAVVDLPEDVTFAEDAPKEIVFDPGGRLARAIHDKPVEIGIELGEGRAATVRVNVYGTVE